MTSHYLLPCTCGQKVRIVNAQAGGKVACGCGKSLSVPTLRGLRELELAPPEMRSAASPGWSRVHGGFFASGLLIATLGFVMVAYSLFRYTQIVGFSTDRSSEVVQFESANIDKLTAIQMLGAWSELLTEGLGEKQTPIWVAAKEKIAEYQRWMIVGGSALAAGIVVSVATLFIGRPSRSF